MRASGALRAILVSAVMAGVLSIAALGAEQQDHEALMREVSNAVLVGTWEVAVPALKRWVNHCSESGHLNDVFAIAGSRTIVTIDRDLGAQYVKIGFAEGSLYVWRNKISADVSTLDPSEFPVATPAKDEPDPRPVGGYDRQALMKEVTEALRSPGLAGKIPVLRKWVGYCRNERKLGDFFAIAPGKPLMLAKTREIECIDVALPGEASLYLWRSRDSAGVSLGHPDEWYDAHRYYPSLQELRQLRPTTRPAQQRPAQ